MSDETQSTMDPNSQFGYCDDGVSSSLELLVSQLFDDDSPDCAGEFKGSTSGVSELEVKQSAVEAELKESVLGADGEQKEPLTLDMEALASLLDKAKTDSSFEALTALVKQAMGAKFEDLDKSAQREREKICNIRQSLQKCTEKLAGTKQKMMWMLTRFEDGHPSIPRETRTAMKRCIEEVSGSSADVERAAHGLRSRELAQSKLVQSGASLASSEAERVLTEHKPNYIRLEHIVNLFFR